MQEPTNKDRAAWALVGVKAFAERVYSRGLDAEDLETIMTDFVADLMHLASKEGFDWDEVIRHAQGHFDTEVDEESQDVLEADTDAGVEDDD